MDAIQTVLTIIGSVLCSSGFWAYLTKKREKKDLKAKMLIGLGHDRIVDLGMKYIERSYITADEYENLVDYLWAPYSQMGGNGSAERIINEVKKLEIRNYKDREVYDNHDA